MKSNKLVNFRNKIDEWDKRTIIQYNGIGGKYFTYILKLVSFFGRETPWIFLIAFYLLIWYDPLKLSYIGITFLCGVIFILSIKNTVKRERPFKVLEELRSLERNPTSKSFPSWHAYNVASQGLIIGILLNSILITILMLIFAVIVAFSRVQLGVHYPSDVIIGYILGILVGILILIYMGPIVYSIITYLEGFAMHEIEYNSLNSMLREVWFVFICLIVFGLIILLATYKIIKEKPLKV